MDREVLLTEIEQRVDVLGQSISSGGGEKTLPSLGDQEAVPRSLKYSEGRLAALMEARLAIRDAHTRTAVRRALDESVKRWKSQLGTHRQRFGGKNAWIDYDEGALEELARLRGQIH